jgi:hypothetical protein
MSHVSAARSINKPRSLVFASAALAMLVTLLGWAEDAEARHRWRWRSGWLGFAAGAAAGAVVGSWVHQPPFWFGYHSHHHHPAPYVYGHGYGPSPPPPPPVAVQPAYVQPAYGHPRVESPHIGLAVAGLVETPQSGQLPLGGMSAALQFRTSRHSLLSLELQSLGAHRRSDDARRSDLGGLVAGRVFLWNAAFAPYLELAGGLGRGSIRTSAFEVHAVQLLGRVGVGLELRLGRHVVLDGQIAQMHRLRFDEDGGSTEGHERSTVFRGGLGLRF